MLVSMLGMFISALQGEVYKVCFRNTDELKITGLILELCLVISG